jgi:hypothetical protein
VHKGEGASTCVTSCGGLRSGQSVLRQAGGLHTFELSLVEVEVVEAG